MQNAKYKLAGWGLCLASLLLLSAIGKLDLLVVLLPVSAILTLLTAGFTSGKTNADGKHKKGIA